MLVSYQEFDIINKQYIDWYKLIKFKINKEGKLSQDMSQHSAYYQMEVPKIDVKLIFDREEDKELGN